MEWTAEADAQVLAYLAEGLTRAAIAERMGVSRNAICGKVHRLSRLAPGFRQCIALSTSMDGRRCLRAAVSGDYCLQHSKMLMSAPPRRAGRALPMIPILALPAPRKRITLAAPPRVIYLPGPTVVVLSRRSFYVVKISLTEDRASLVREFQAFDEASRFSSSCDRKHGDVHAVFQRGRQRYTNAWEPISNEMWQRVAQIIERDVHIR